MLAPQSQHYVVIIVKYDINNRMHSAHAILLSFLFQLVQLLLHCCDWPWSIDALPTLKRALMAFSQLSLQLFLRMSCQDFLQERWLPMHLT